jgi:L-ascorbate metabolism protein UlaG (beta-lactamase superfamily)
MKKAPVFRALIMAGLLTAAVVVSCTTTANQGDDVVNSVNYKNGKFLNVVPNKKYSFSDYITMTKDFFFGDKSGRVPEQPLPVISPEDFTSPPAGGIQYNWLGHSSLILELEGKRFLLDPVFSGRASFAQWMGPKRFHPTPVTLEELPHIDAVLISHNHYDHMDRMAVEHMIEKDVRFHVPLGVGDLVVKWGAKKENVVEFDWWDEVKVGEVRVVATPARHFSARGLFDRDETFWVSWSIVGARQKAFFSGDTGMTPQFSEIGERLGPFDITFIKIGAYDEQWPDIHLNPEEAVQAHVMLKGNQLVPIHWGTFDLALHSWQEPIERILIAAKEEKVSVVTSKIGETVVPSQHENSYWWRGLDSMSATGKAGSRYLPEESTPR